MVAAVPTASFINSLGVQVHLGYNATVGDTTNAYNNIGAVQNALGYLGISNVRDSLGYDYYLPQVERLGAAGVKFDIYLGTGDDLDHAAEVQRIASHAGMIRYVEGPNEVDIWPAKFGGQTGYDAARAEMASVYHDLNADPRTANIPILPPTIGNPVENAGKLGDMSATSDLGAAHVYPPADTPPGDVFSSPYFTSQHALTPADRVVITEGGYSTTPMATHNGSVSEAVHAKLLLDYVLDAYKAGVPTTYLYELADEHADPGGSDREQHFGLYHTDWTPKPAAVALHNLTTILGEHGSASGGSVNYSLSGLPMNNSLALQGGDGTQYVVVWRDLDLWDAASAQAIPISAIPGQVDLGARFGSVQVFDPLAGTAPIQTLSNVQQVGLSVADHPLILAFRQPVTFSTPVTGTPAPAQLSAGSGADSLVLHISQDAWQGSAQYAVSVDGRQVGGTFTAAALHTAAVGDATDTLTLRGDWTTGTHHVEVRFLNDLYGGSAATDRNLYVEGASYDGRAVAGAQAPLYSPGSASFAVTDTTSRTLISGTSAGERMSVGDVHGVDVDGRGGRDTIILGAQHTDVRIMGAAGETGGDTVQGFKPGGDTLVLRGYGAHATLTSGGAGVFVADGNGHHDIIDIPGATLATLHYSIV